MPADKQITINASLGMESTDDLGLYLCMPTVNSWVTQDTYAHLCEKIDKRLIGWKSKYLSMEGPITLANSTITTMANYSMQRPKFREQSVITLINELEGLFGAGLMIRNVSTCSHGTQFSCLGTKVG